MKKIILLCLTIILCCIACSKPEISTLGSISGIVVDASSKNAISGVKVTLSPGGSSQLTGKDGTFSFEELESQEYTLSFTKDNYESETQKVMVRANISSNVQISLLPIQPILTVNTNVLNFGNETSTLAIDITNTGKGVLTWNVNENIEWISCSPDKGETEKEKSTLVVTADRSKLEQGNYSESFVVGSNGGSATIVVSISVNNIKLSVEPSELDFETLSNSKQLLLTNTATGSLRYSASSSRSWLTLSKESGSITTSDYITAVVSREGLSAGHYDANIVFSTDGGEVTVPVKMDVAVNETPTVTVESVSEIKFNSALLHGTVVSVGSDKISRYGFCWGEKSTPTIEDNFSNLGDCSTAEAFESIANNLKSETKYYFRAYAENNVGLVYSEKTLSFTTTGLPSLPGVSTGSVENVTANTARAKGTLTSLGNVDKITHYGHVWGPSAKPTLEDAKFSDLGEATATSSFVSDVSGLSSHTTYYIRAYATNEKGTSYGEDVSFVTSKEDAKVSTSEVTEIVHNAATCGGVITQTGGHTIKEKGVCYGKTAMPTVNDSKQVATSEKDASFSCRITGLEKETTYYVRAYVMTSDNTLFYGDDLSFKTTKEVKLPTLSSVTISNIQTTSATFVGTIISDGESEITECGFCWSDVAEPTIVDNKASCDPQSKEMGKNITSLKEGTKYYVRAYAKNAMGYAYSDVASFETISIVKPEISNLIVTNIGRSTAEASAIIITDGNSAITEYGFCWSTSPEPTIYDNKSSANMSSMTISATVKDLPALSDVYIRAFATNIKGTGYSETVSVKTSKHDNNTWDGSVASSFAGGIGTAENPILIETAAQLKLLANNVNSGTYTYEGVSFKLVSNLNMNNINWEPIGINYKVFKGNFDGDGCNITNLLVESTHQHNEGGLFGSAESLLCNIIVYGKVDVDGYYAGTGGICGELIGQCNNCINHCSVSGNSYMGVGGIVGQLSGTITNCANYGNVSGKYASSSNVHVGGIAGEGYNINGSTQNIMNCSNFGIIKGSIYSYLGGIIGGPSSRDIAVIENCVNAGNFDGGKYRGGIMGYGTPKSINSCYWLYDASNNAGCQYPNGGDAKLTYSETYSFVPIGNACYISPDYTKDLLERLNSWVSSHQSTTSKYVRWEYKNIGTNSIPAPVINY